MIKRFFLSNLIFISILVPSEVNPMEIDVSSTETVAFDHKNSQNLFSQLPDEIISIIVVYLLKNNDNLEEAIKNFKRFIFTGKTIQNVILSPFSIKLFNKSFSESHVQFFVLCGFNGIWVARKLKVKLSNELSEKYKRKNFENELNRYGFNYKQLSDCSDEYKLDTASPERLRELFFSMIKYDIGWPQEICFGGKNNTNTLILLTLFNAGININTLDNEARPVIARLAQNPIYDVTPLINLLLNLGADPNIQEPDSKADALLYAMHKKSDDKIKKNIIGILLEAGASPNIRNKHGHTALIELLWVNSNSFGKSIVTGISFDERPVYLKNKDDIKAIVKLLLDAGVDVNIRDDRGWTALNHAIRNNHDPEIIQLLKDHERRIAKNKPSRCTLS